MLNSRLVIPVVAIVFVTFLFTGTLLADPPKDKGKPEKTNSEESAGKRDHDVNTRSIMVSAGISLGDARKLATQYQLTGGKPLPPGIRKNLARGKPMPPGIQKTRLPGAFIEHLPYHEGFEWQQAGTDLVLLVEGSLEIADVLSDVFD